MFDDLADPLGPPTGEALGLVLARARRRRFAQRSAFAVIVAGAVAAIAVGANALDSGSSAIRVAGTSNPAPGPTTTTVPPTSTSSTTTSSTTSTGPPPAGAFLDISATPTITGARLSLAVVVDGQVPQLYGGYDGQPISGTAQSRHVRIDFGDGSLIGGADGGDVTCRPGAPLVPIHESWTDAPPSSPPIPPSRPIGAWFHTYARPGTYDVTFSVLVCGLGDVKKQITVTIA